MHPGISFCKYANFCGPQKGEQHDTFLGLFKWLLLPQIQMNYACCILSTSILYTSIITVKLENKLGPLYFLGGLACF